MKALVRRPSPRLGDGIVTHVPRQPVDVGVAREQWAAYVRALEDAGWETLEVPPADDCPDGVFVEDTAVVFEGIAALTRPGAEARRTETDGVEQALAGLGYTVERIEGPATLDGGDVLRLSDVLYVGVGRRTNPEGARQLRALTGAHVVPVSVPPGVLHLKTAVTFLPDNTRVEGNALPLDDRRVLVPSSAHGLAATVAKRGYTAVCVDISELEKLEGGVTCLSVPLGG